MAATKKLAYGQPSSTVTAQIGSTEFHKGTFFVYFTPAAEFWTAEELEWLKAEAAKEAKKSDLWPARREANIICVRLACVEIRPMEIT